MARNNGKRNRRWFFRRRNRTTVDVVARGSLIPIARQLPLLPSSVAASAPRIIKDSATAVVVRIPNDRGIIAQVIRTLRT